MTPEEMGTNFTNHAIALNVAARERRPLSQVIFAPNGRVESHFEHRYPNTPHHIAASSTHAAYQATKEFIDYLSDKALWEAAHAEYVANSNPVTRNWLTIREHNMKVSLRIARETPEHLAAFGW